LPYLLSVPSRSSQVLINGHGKNMKVPGTRKNRSTAKDRNFYTLLANIGDF